MLANGFCQISREETQERIKREKGKRSGGRTQYTISRCKSGMELYHFAKVNEINKTGSKVNFILLHILTNFLAQNHPPLRKSSCWGKGYTSNSSLQGSMVTMVVCLLTSSYRMVPFSMPNL